MNEPDVSVQIGGLKLRNPLVLLSGTAGSGYEMQGLLDLNSVGAVVAKTITLGAREGNPPPRIAEVYGGVINAIGLENPGADGFKEKYWPRALGLPCPVIVSVGGHSEEEIVTAVAKVECLPGLEAIELNMSCPNVRMQRLMSQEPALAASLIGKVRAMTGKTLIAKLTPQVTDIVEIARAAVDAGADALCLVNTFPAMKIDIHTRKPVLGNVYGGLSGRCVKPMAVRAVHQVYASGIRVPVIASGGVYEWQDVIEFILAGACAVGIGTANFLYPDAAEKILKDLILYCKTNRINKLSDMRGAAH